jgi:hypothetical protein
MLLEARGPFDLFTLLVMPQILSAVARAGVAASPRELPGPVAGLEMADSLQVGSGMGYLLGAIVWQAKALMSSDVLIRPRVRRASKGDSSVATEVSATIFLVSRFQVVRGPTSVLGDRLGGLGQAYRGIRARCRRSLLR